MISGAMRRLSTWCAAVDRRCKALLRLTPGSAPIGIALLLAVVLAACPMPQPVQQTIAKDPQVTSLPTPTSVAPATDIETAQATATAVLMPTAEPALTVTLTPTLVITGDAATLTTTVVLLPTPTPKATTPLSESVTISTASIVLPTPTPNVSTLQAPRPPEPTPDGAVRVAHVPILMYHYLSAPPADADAYRLDLSVAPELFASHLDRMLADGYTTINLYDLLEHLTNGSPLPPKPVIITFDDGYRDNYENALPLLSARGMKATFFVVTDFIDEERPDYLTWDMARAMLAAGMSVEAHSRNHASLKGRDNDFLVWQALGCKETIEAELGVRPRFVSYPAGEYDQATMDLFKSADYWGGITTKQGASHTLDKVFEITRVRVRGTTTADELARLLALDW